MNTNKSKSRFFKPLYLSLAIVLLCSHDLYIKMETYFLQPNEKASLSLYNGTFEKSENIITRDRMLDASIVAQGKRSPIDPTEWEDQDSTITQLGFNTGGPGTYVVGVSTKARNIELSAKKFNDYLQHDGVIDMLEQRTTENLLDQDAVESYQKHVKAIYQVGDVKTNDWGTKLGYPIEFVPQGNPYERYSGETLEVQLLHEGQPLANQVVFADYLKAPHAHVHEDQDHGHQHEKEESTDQHTHGDGNSTHSHASEDEVHTHTTGQQLRTNAQGIISVDLPEDGVYYLRTIYMTTAPDDDELTHRSKWATLTFEVSHQHGASTHTHDDENGVPMWIFIAGSVLVIGLLFFVFKKKNS